MEKYQAKKLLDDISKSIKILNSYEDYTCGIVTSGAHMHKCLREISELMELELEEKPWECDGATATEISFLYNGVCFFELEGYKGCVENAGNG